MTEKFLDIQGVEKSFRQGQNKIDVLKGLSLEVQKGETVAVIGQSGSGKSTFLSLLAGLDKPDRGDIKLGSQSLVQMPEKPLTKFRGRHIGVIFQQFHLLSGLTAFENISLPLEILGVEEKERTNRVHEALTDVGLDHRAHHFPQQLSGGERQRVAIARAMIHRPDLLLADEPSGNLDMETGEKVMGTLFDLVSSHKMTMILVTHSLLLAKSCERGVKLTKGTLEPYVVASTDYP